MKHIKTEMHDSVNYYKVLYFSSLSLQVLREEEFAPVKNANGSNFDTPESARLLVLRLHTRWVIAAGGFLTHSVPLYATGKEPIQLLFSFVFLYFINCSVGKRTEALNDFKLKVHN